MSSDSLSLSLWPSHFKWFPTGWQSIASCQSVHAYSFSKRGRSSRACLASDSQPELVVTGATNRWAPAPARAATLREPVLTRAATESADARCRVPVETGWAKLQTHCCLVVPRPLQRRYFQSHDSPGYLPTPCTSTRCNWELECYEKTAEDRQMGPNPDVNKSINALSATACARTTHKRHRLI